MGRIETHLIEKIALYMIRIRRARSLEADFLNQGDPLPSPAMRGSVKAKLRTQRDVLEILLRTYQRYESIFSARLIKAVRQLERVQQQRRSEAVPVLNVQIHGGEEKGWSMPPAMIQGDHEEYVGTNTTTNANPTLVA